MASLIELMQSSRTITEITLTHYRPGVGIIHRDVTRNLCTNDGFDKRCDAEGGGPPGYTAALTSVTATSATDTAAAPANGAANIYKGRRLHAVQGSTLVWATILSHTWSNPGIAFTLDGWKKVSDNTAATTPAGTAVYAVGGAAPAIYIALSTDAAAPAATDTTLAGEVTTNGLGRKAAAYTHTIGTAVYSLTAVFTATGAVSAVQKMGLGDSMTASTGLLAREAAITSRNIASADVLTITVTVTES